MQCPNCRKWWAYGGGDEADMEGYAVCSSCETEVDVDDDDKEDG